MKTKTFIALFVAALVIAAFASRFLPHIPNATAASALALVAGAYLGRKSGVALTLAMLFISDLLIGFYEWQVMAVVYGSFALMAAMGYLMRPGTPLLQKGGIALMSSTLFFLTTNTAVWAFSPWYAKNMSGLLLALEAGVPFWRNMALGDALFVPLFFSLFALAPHAARLASRTAARVPALAFVRKD